MKKKTVELFLLILPILFFSAGCGGGGGGGAETTTTPVTPPASQIPVASANTVATLSGIVSFPLSTSASRSRIDYGISRAVSSVLKEQTKSPIGGVKIEAYAAKNTGLGFSNLLKLGEMTTTNTGNYSISILDTHLKELSLLTGGDIQSLNDLYTKSLYRIRLIMTKTDVSTATSINKNITFQPAYNKNSLGSATASLTDLTVNTLIDFSNQNTAKLEILNTKELTSWKSRLDTYKQQYQQGLITTWNPSEWVANQLCERLILQENIDTNGNGLPDETAPLNIFEKPQIQNDAPVINNGKVVRVFEMDANGDGTFGTGEDLVSATVFGETDPQKQVASFVDLNSSGTITPQNVLTGYDQTPPEITFVSPTLSEGKLPNVTGDLFIKVRYRDNVAYDLSTLKVWFNQKVEFLSPTRFTLKSGSDFSRSYFEKGREILSSQEYGIATYTLKNIVFAVGLHEHTLYASIADFSGKIATASASFVVNGPPEIEGVHEISVPEGDQVITSSFRVRDVDPLTIRLEMGSGASVPSWIYLTSALEPALPKTQIQLTQEQIIGGNFSFSVNIRPGHDFASVGNQVVRIIASDGSSPISFAVTIRPQAKNTPSQFLGICYTNRTGGLLTLSQNPQKACEQLNDIFYCRNSTNATTPMTVPENENLKFVLCGAEKDSEDEVQFSFKSITSKFSTTSASLSSLEPTSRGSAFTKPTPLGNSATGWYHMNSASVAGPSLTTKSTISLFEWTPDGISYFDQNKLVFEATDGKGSLNCLSNPCIPSVSMSIILSVVTVQDAPFIEQISATSTVLGTWPLSGGIPYAEDSPLLVSGKEKIEDWRFGSTKLLFKAQQDKTMEITFTASDDENPYDPQDLSLAANLPILSLSSKPSWLSLISDNSARKNYLLILKGTPTKEDALTDQQIRITTIDPGKGVAPATTYSFPIQILDQNDKPWFLDDSSQALLQTPSSLSPSQTVTITINATEDIPLTFYVHAVDIDPKSTITAKQSPYFRPDLFKFTKDDISFSKLKEAPVLTELAYSPTNSYKTLKIQWTPRSADTIDTGLQKTKDNFITISVEAPCPSGFLPPNCKTQVNPVQIHLKVLSVDEPAHFRRVLIEPKTDLRGDSYWLSEGVVTKIRQEVEDEEGALIDEIKATSVHNSLINLVTIGSKPQKTTTDGTLPHLLLQDQLISDSYVRQENGVLCNQPLWISPESADCIPARVTMTIEVTNKILATSNPISRSRILTFQIEDLAEAPSFVDPSTHRPDLRISDSTQNKVYTAPMDITSGIIEDQPYTMKIAAYNRKDKNPIYWDGFKFEIVQFPNPRGNFTLSQNTESTTTSTSAIITWTPTQEHVSGTNSKVHPVIVRVCIRKEQPFQNDCIPGTENLQTFNLTVNPAKDAPILYWGEEKRNLLQDPITIANPIVIQEYNKGTGTGGIFEKLIRVEDEDLQSVRLQMSVTLANIPGAQAVQKRGIGGLVTSTNATLSPLPTQSFDSDIGANFVQTNFRWSQIDWYDISMSATNPRTSAYYILKITGITPSESGPTSKTETGVWLRVDSVNDKPSFTTATIAKQLGQTEGIQPDNSYIPVKIVDLFDVIDNEEDDSLQFLLRSKGTAEFLDDVSSTSLADRTHTLYTLTAAGETGVGTHVLDFEAREISAKIGAIADPVLAHLSLVVVDSNDRPLWSGESLFADQPILNEGVLSDPYQLYVRDPDLFSSASQEKITHTIQGNYSQDYTTATLFFSNQKNLITSSDIILQATTLPSDPVQRRQPIGFQIFPQRLGGNNPFAITTYYFNFIATDSYKSQFLTTFTTIAFRIQPRDDRPLFASIANSPVPTVGNTVPVCITPPNCSGTSMFLKADSSVFTFSVTAVDQESEPLHFSFVTPGTDLETLTSLPGLTLSTLTYNFSPHHSNPDSVKMTFIPTNGLVGLQTFHLKVIDSNSSGSIIDTSRSSTRTFSFLVQNTADAPEFKNIYNLTDKSMNYLLSTSQIIFYEDQINTLMFLIDDKDLYIPKSFTTSQKAILTQDYKLSESEILALEQGLFPQEFFSWQITNLTTFPGLKMHSSDYKTQVFAYTQNSTIAQTSTSNLIRLTWVPTDSFTFPKYSGTNGIVDLNFLLRSYSGNSVLPTKPNSATKSAKIKVWPVNDKPKILNSETEAAATQDSAFSFTILASDEEENSLSYHFVSGTTQPGDMVLQGNLINWNPTNTDTKQNYYDLKIYAKDTGKRTSIAMTPSLPADAPKTSTVYNLRVYLNDRDDPVVRDGNINPGISTLEDELYSANLKYSDPDFKDRVVYSLINPPNGMSIEDLDGDGEALIRWTPSLPGNYNISIQVASMQESVLRSTVYYNYTLSVLPKNDPPVFNSTPSDTLVENKPYVYDINATDEDDSSITLKLNTQAPCNDPSKYLTLFESDKKLQGSTDLSGINENILTNAIVETIRVCLEASDGINTTTQSFDLKVQADNNPAAIFSQSVSILNATKTAVEKGPWVLSQNVLLEDNEPLIYSNPSIRIVTGSQGRVNIVTMKFTDEEENYPLSFAISQGPGGSLLYNPSAVSSPATVTLTWVPLTSHIAQNQAFKIRITDSKNRQTDFEFRTNVKDTPEPPSYTFSKATTNLSLDLTGKAVQLINEDLVQTINLGASDPDLNSILSFSIVTDLLVSPHPKTPIYNHKPLAESKFDLKINNSGEVTFLPGISTPSIVPVTFSICGTSRSQSAYNTDCTTATFKYQIIARNDEPYFSPSVAPTLKTTAKEGNSYKAGRGSGLTFRRVRSQDPCPTETSQEICLIDEESDTYSDLGGANPKLSLAIVTPAVLPQSMRLTPAVSSCFHAQSGVDYPPVGSDFNTACNGFTSTRLTWVQTLVWDLIPYDQPRVLNLEIEAKEKIDSTKTAKFSLSLEIENTNLPPVINSGFSLIPVQINESESFTWNFADRCFDGDSPADPLSYHLIKGVSSMTINTNTGLLSWTPKASHIGQHKIRLECHDYPEDLTQAKTVQADLLITVLKKNNPPFIDSNLKNRYDTTKNIDHVATEGVRFEAQVFAKDEEGDLISFIPSQSTLNGSPLPSGFSLTSYGLIEWTPTNTNVGANELFVVVKDNTSQTASNMKFILSVKNTNNPPVISNKISSTIAIDEEQLYERQYLINDPDTTDSHFFSVSSSPAISASISLKGKLSILPGASDSGSYQMFVVVTDLAGAKDTDNFILQVNTKNNPPIMESIPDPLFVKRGNTYTYQLRATDPENDTLSYFFTAKPTNVVLEQSTGLLIVTPLETIVDQQFEVYAKDVYNQESIRRIVKLKYIDFNPPIIKNEPNKNGKILNRYSYTPDSEPAGAAIELIEAPTGMSINANTLEWTPAYNPPFEDQSGIHVIVIRVTTTVSGISVKSEPLRWLLTIDKENSAPVVEYVKDLTGKPITTYDAVEDLAFENLIVKIKDADTTDLERLKFYHQSTKTNQASANPLSPQQGTLVELSRSVVNGAAEVLVELQWTPGNEDAQAQPKGYKNQFIIMASDGITQSNTLAVEFNVTDVNDLPVFDENENKGFSEIGEVGKRYHRAFYARDVDNQYVYFCFDTKEFWIYNAINTDPTYPSLSPLSTQGPAVLWFEGDGPGDSGTASVPANTYCVKGLDVPEDPTPEKGKLSKIDMYWEPTDYWFENEPYENLPLILWDRWKLEQTTKESFTLKLSPSISNLIPNMQYIGEEVAISGGGIIKSSNQLTVKFLRSDGSISAVTEVYGLDSQRPGQGKFIVPNGAVSGFVSVGYTSFSSPVPFTVLNGKTTIVAGKSNLDFADISFPSGLLVTSVLDNVETHFVSDFENHAIFYFQKKNGVFGEAKILCGSKGSKGDSDGTSTTARFFNPTGLSFARYQNKNWLLIADTGNHKIKATDITSLFISDPDLETKSVYTYTIASSTHLNRPYKAIQHTNPTSSGFFYIANTFGNTIELLFTGKNGSEKAFKNLTNREPKENELTYKELQNGRYIVPDLSNPKWLGSRNTYTVAGTGTARSDILGNLFHPTDLSMIKNGGNDGILVSNYSNYPYSLNSSTKIFLNEGINRNTKTTKRYYFNDLSLASFGNGTTLGDIALVSQSSINEWVTTNGITLIIPKQEITDRIDRGIYLHTSSSHFSKSPVVVNTEMNTRLKEKLTDPNVDFQEKTLYQSRELNFSKGVNQVGFSQNPGSTTEKTSIYVQPGSREVGIVPISNNTYSISAIDLKNLPNFQGKTIGEPFYYDTNSDDIDDLWLPIPDLSSIYVFPGKVSSDENTPPLTFDFNNYWLINNTSLNCAVTDCLKGVRSVNFGRVHYMNGVGANKFTSASLRSEDLIMVTDVKKSIYIVESFVWNNTDVDVQNLPANIDDLRFHLHHSDLADASSVTIYPVGEQQVYFTNGDGGDWTSIYNFKEITFNTSPWEVCTGVYTRSSLQTECRYTANGNVCLRAPSQGATPQETDIKPGWGMPKSVWNENSNDILNLESLIVRNKPDNQGKSAGFLLHLMPGTLPVSKEFETSIYSKIQCGQPYTRTNIILSSKSVTNEDGFSTQPISLSQYGKPDSVMYIDSNGKFKMIDFEDTDRFNAPVVKSFPSVDTTLKDSLGNALSAGIDFVLVDVNSDGVRDLATIHSTSRKLSVRIGTGNSAGALFSEQGTDEVQTLDTLEDPTFIDIFYPDTQTDGNGKLYPNLIVTNTKTNSITIFEHKKSAAKAGKWYSDGLHFNVGNSGNFVARAIRQVTDGLYTGNTFAPLTKSGTMIWDRYYYGTQSVPFYHSGISSDITVQTSGIVLIQQADDNIVKSGAMRAFPEQLFRSGRSVFVTTYAAFMQTGDLNNDNRLDIVTIDPLYQKFSVVLTKPTQSLTFDQNVKTYSISLGRGVAAAIGDMDERLDNNPVPSNRKRHSDIVIPVYDADKIALFFNAGIPQDSNLYDSYIFNHPAFPSKNYTVGKGPAAVVVAKLDNDEHLDIAVANKVSNNICVMYNDPENVGNFSECTFYGVDFSPMSIFAMELQTHIASVSTTTQCSNCNRDLVILNETGKSVSVLLNKFATAKPVRGYESPRTISIAQYFPSTMTLTDPNTGLPTDPFAQMPRTWSRGNFGNTTAGASLSGIAPDQKFYENLLIGSESLLYVLKNIGGQEDLAYKSSLSQFLFDDLSLSATSVATFASGVTKSFVISGPHIFASKSELNAALWDPSIVLGTKDSYYAKSELLSIPITNPASVQAYSSPTGSSFDLIKEQLGSGFDAMSSAKINGTTRVFAAHSGRFRGILEITSQGAGYQTTYVLNSPIETILLDQYTPEYSEDVRLNEPAGMGFSPDLDSIWVSDFKNSLIRIVDLEANTTRVLLSDNVNALKIPNVIGIVNLENTYNYYVITTDRKLFLVNPSQSPTSLTTQVLDIDFTTGIHSNFSWFKILRYKHYLYIGAKNTIEAPTSGRIYRIDTRYSPMRTETIRKEIDGVLYEELGGVNGFVLNTSGKDLFYSDYNTSTLIYLKDISDLSANPKTVAGISQLKGHFDGSNTVALLQNPGDMAINYKEDTLFFIDSSAIRTLRLDHLNDSQNMEVATISGDPFRTGVSNGDGQKARFIYPSHLLYMYKNGKDLLFISDKEANNIRKVEIQP